MQPGAFATHGTAWQTRACGIGPVRGPAAVVLHKHMRHRTCLRHWRGACMPQLSVMLMATACLRRYPVTPDAPAESLSQSHGPPPLDLGLAFLCPDEAPAPFGSLLRQDGPDLRPDMTSPFLVTPSPRSRSWSPSCSFISEKKHACFAAHLHVAPLLTEKRERKLELCIL